MKPCVMSGCNATGEPSSGEDFFLCDDCRDSLESLCEETAQANAAQINHLMGVR